MGEHQGPYATDLNNVFKKKDVALVRSFLIQHKIDVNVCGIKTREGGWLLATPLVHAIANFDGNVMKCLLEEFGADVNAPCYRTHGGPISVEDYPLFQACCTPDDPVEATEFLLDRGASPFAVPYGMSSSTLNSAAMGLFEAGKRRTYAAWAVAWSLSQRPPQSTSVWGLRDVAQQVAQCIMVTPVREFLREEGDFKRHKK